MYKPGIPAVVAVLAVLAASGCARDTTLHTRSDRAARQPEGRQATAAVDADVSDLRDRDLPVLGPDASLRDYLTYAALKSPALRAAFDQWKAAVEQGPQARSLPNPKFTYGYYIREVETRVGPQRHRLALAQKLPWFGTLDLRGATARAAAESAFQQYQARKLRLFYDIKDAYYEYYYLGQAVEITRQNVRLLENLERVVSASYRAAAAEHPHLIRLQVELGKLSDRLAGLRDMRQPVMARLAAALDLPADHELPWPKKLEAGGGGQAPDEQLVALAADFSPQLKALDAEIERRKTEILLAKKAYYPDVTLGLTWIETDHRNGLVRPRDSGRDPVIAMISVDLPIWWGKLAAGVRQGRFRRTAAIGRKRDRTRRLEAQVKQTSYQWRDAQRKIDLYRRVLIPKASESLKVTESAFRTGKANFNGLIDAQRVLLTFQLTEQRALTDRARHRAKLEMLIGRELPDGGSAPAVPGVQEDKDRGEEAKEPKP